jgi:hypothetical protein
MAHSAAGPFGASHYITKAAEGNAQVAVNRGWIKTENMHPLKPN